MLDWSTFGFRVTRSTGTARTGWTGALADLLPNNIRRHEIPPAPAPRLVVPAPLWVLQDPPIAESTVSKWWHLKQNLEALILFGVKVAVHVVAFIKISSF